MAQELKKYIKTLTDKGRSLEDIKQSLLTAGWGAKDVEEAIKESYFGGLDGDVPLPPSPPQRERHSMVQISVNFFSFILLWIVALATGTLYFEVINGSFPDSLTQGGLEGYRSSNDQAIYSSMAAVIVALPLYLWTMWFWFRGFARRPEQQESRLSKWFTYIILLGAAGTIVGDLISVIAHFLQGETIARGILKNLTLFVIAGAIFSFYFFERRKVQYKKKTLTTPFILIGVLSLIVAVTGIALGFAVAGSPQEARLKGFDSQRVDDLTQISQAVDNFALGNNRLPQDLKELVSNVNSFVSNTTDPETGSEYEYRAVSTNQFELCATFSLPTPEGSTTLKPYPLSIWSQHDKGKVCETQTVTFSPGRVPSPLMI
jgi:hypothetical protein